MRTVKRNPFLSGVCAILGGVFLWAGTARADVTSDRAAGILVIPKLIFDSTGRFVPERRCRPTPRSSSPTSRTSRSTCGASTSTPTRTARTRRENVCFTTADCQRFGAGGLCFDGWIETDFEFRLTPRQPIVWRISEGLFTLAAGTVSGR